MVTNQMNKKIVKFIYNNVEMERSVNDARGNDAREAERLTETEE